MLSVVHLSPTALSHTWRHCWHAQLGGRLLQGCIRLHKVYSIFLQPASLYASTITSYRICFNCSRSCEILCIPMFYGRLLLQTLSDFFICFLMSFSTSVYIYSYIFWLFFFCFDGVVCFFVVVIMDNACSGWCDNAFLFCNLARLSPLVHFQCSDSDFTLTICGRPMWAVFLTA